jgi:hypothetical protein
MTPGDLAELDPMAQHRMAGVSRPAQKPTRAKQIPLWGVRTPRPASQRPARRDFHEEVRTPFVEQAGWHQPGRRFGPSPLGPDKPKMNKVTDRDGNPRVVPLTWEQRHRAYVTLPRRWTGGDGGGDRIERRTRATEAQRHPLYFASLSGQERAALLGVTPRQLRRLEHKENHAAAPFGKIKEKRNGH